MRPVEQAIFTSVDTDRAAGYQIAARSPGVCEADAQELAVWGPSHDAMLDSGPEAESFNFHPLPSGAHCISRTMPAGWEYGGGRQRVCTHCLIVPPEVLARFGNNPVRPDSGGLGATAVAEARRALPTAGAAATEGHRGDR